MKKHDDFNTKVTRINYKLYGCRIFYKGELILEAKVESRDKIGPAFRDMFRTLDHGHCHGNLKDEFTKGKMLDVGLDYSYILKKETLSIGICRH